MTEARLQTVRPYFAQRLKELRTARGFRTARSLARALEIDENRYTRYERAEVEPDLTLLVRICETLGVTPNDLLVSWSTPSPREPLPGFAEKSESVRVAGGNKPIRSADASTRSAEVESADAARDAARARQRALAWQLASELAKLGSRPDTSMHSPIASLQTKSRLFAEIEKDPFAFIRGLAEDARLAELNLHEQARIAGLVDDLITAVNSAHL
jgi:transcriptional regulator with XRE-family HTH domain